MADHPHLFFTLVIGALLAACSADTPVPPRDPRADRIASLEKITAGCDLPAETLKLISTDEVIIQVQMDTDYGKVDCLLRAIKKADPKLKFGFLGNEAYYTENRQ